MMTPYDIRVLSRRICVDEVKKQKKNINLNIGTGLIYTTYDTNTQINHMLQPFPYTITYTRTVTITNEKLTLVFLVHPSQ
jgi:hypothetical protein